MPAIIFIFFFTTNLQAAIPLGENPKPDSYLEAYYEDTTPVNEKFKKKETTQKAMRVKAKKNKEKDAPAPRRKSTLKSSSSSFWGKVKEKGALYKQKASQKIDKASKKISEAKEDVSSYSSEKYNEAVRKKNEFKSNVKSKTKRGVEAVKRKLR